jgi:hypothetical protein
MNYLTFIFKDPETLQVKCVGVKYKKTEFDESDLAKLVKSGTSNIEVKLWLKELRKKNQVPVLEILYRGKDSCEACFIKQQILIQSVKDNIDLLGQQPLTKKYTKKVRNNNNMRCPIRDQYGSEYPGILEAAELLLLAPSNISKVLHGKLEHIGGYKFTFI